MNPRLAAIAFAILVFAELAAFAAFVTGAVNLTGFLTLHLAACMPLLAVAWRSGRGGLLIGALAVLAAGPAGAAAGLLCLSAAGRLHGSLREWHNFIARGDAAAGAEVFARLSSGQALDANRSLPKKFEEIFDSGSLRDQQALLGLMAQSYHPSFRKILQKALRSPSAPIRVQAASVFTALRAREKLRLAEAAARTANGTPQPDIPTVIRLANSQFLDDGERNSVKVLLRRTLDHMTASLEATDPPRAARVRILANAGLLGPAADLAQNRVPQRTYGGYPDA